MCIKPEQKMANQSHLPNSAPPSSPTPQNQDFGRASFSLLLSFPRVIWVTAFPSLPRNPCSSPEHDPQPRKLWEHLGCWCSDPRALFPRKSQTSWVRLLHRFPPLSNTRLFEAQSTALLEEEGIIKSRAFVREEKGGKGFKQSCQKLYSRRDPDTNHPGLLLQPYQVKSKDTARACNFVRMPLMNWIRLWKNLSNSEFWYVSFQEVNNYSQTADN